ncbi:MAG: serine acetyltransferase [Eubacteriales bacterium]|nr:serine acetyltransferase [Eubacteriales bacterium]MDD3883230.1 serine acetyltransferase [Eubacteriales bacterium]MDD4513848.1 serine acetyltransferase [Eubacteriales bacterium]
MIKNKQDLQLFLAEDKKALGAKGKRPRLHDYIWRYERALRYYEYYCNCAKGAPDKLFRWVAKQRLMRLGMKCGFSIPVNVAGKGLNIAHIGTIIINRHARIGDYCRMHVGVNIGTEAGFDDRAPQIGNFVYIGPGAKLFGGITIADDIAIGANAVVNKSFTEAGKSIGGIPAKVISDKGSRNLVYHPPEK